MISILYKNGFGIQVRNYGYASIEDAKNALDEIVCSGRCETYENTDGSIKMINASIISDEDGKYTVIPVCPSDYVINDCSVVAIPCAESRVLVCTKIGDKIVEKFYKNRRNAAIAYVRALHAGQPVYIKNAFGQVVCADNVKGWEEYSIHNDVNIDDFIVDADNFLNEIEI